MMNATEKFFRKIRTRFEAYGGEVTRDTFRGELNYESGRIFYVVLIAAFLFLLYIPNDLRMHPYPIFLVSVKIGFSLLCLTLIALRFTERFKDKPGLLFKVMVGYLYLMAASIMATSGEYAASYISSFSLVIMLFVFTPLTSKFKVIAAISTLVVFSLLSLIFGIDLSEIPVQNAVTDFLAVILAGLLISNSLDKFRYKAWEQRKQLRTTLEEQSYRDNLLNSVNQASAVLLEPDMGNFDGNLFEAMGMMAKAVKVDRMYIWKNHYVEGELHTTQVFEWSGGAEPQQGNELTISIPFPDYWYPFLSQNKSINSLVRDFPGFEREHLQAQGIISILVEPIFIDDKFWGFVGFDDCRSERIFTESEEMILRSASRTITNALIRREMTRDILTTSERLRALNEMSIRFLSQAGESFEDKMSAGIKLIAEKIDFDVVSIWRNFVKPEGVHTTQAYVWDRRLGGTRKPDFVEIPLSRISLNWNKIAFSDDVVNSPVRLLNDPVAKKIMADFGVLSVLITPIIIDDACWGFVLFEDHSKERVFDGNAVEAMWSAAHLCANTLIARDMERNLEDAFDSATAASNAKSEFLSNMSHEMRTPMNAIIGMTAIGKKSRDIGGKNHALNKIDEASSHLLGVINDILDMAKIEANKLDLVPIEYNFERMLQSVVSVVNFRVEEKRQQLTVHVDSKIPRFIIGDDLRLAQAVTNIMSNAVKFTPEGGSIHLEAFLLRETGGECELRIEVTDSGIGIPFEQQERLFLAFEQAESGTSREYGGTGLGLVITKRIAELMGGSIQVESEVGKGARFTLTVKVLRGKKGLHSLLAPGVNWANVRILVVDDMIETHNQFKQLFDTLGIGCDFAQGGLEACRMIEEKGLYDICFIDWRMPDMDGIELTRWIKSHKNGGRSVVIMITAADWWLVRDEASTAGVDMHLLKPLFSSAIIDCINEVLGVDGTGVSNGAETGEFKGKRLLIAEDIEINREILISLLDNTGLIIDCAENGKEALDMLVASDHKYDIVFMDIQMPQMDGLEATRHIRTHPALRDTNLPIIAMTANVFRDDIEECFAAGMDDHIGKPLDIDKVLEKLRKYLNID